MKFITVDLDSTLADTRHRQGMIKPEGGTNWEAYAMECSGDTPIYGNLEMVKALHNIMPVFIISGRHISAITLTLEWLRDVAGWQPDGIMLAETINPGISHEQFKVDAIAILERELEGTHIVHIDDWAPVQRHLEANGYSGVTVQSPTLVAGDVPPDHATFV